ncbi:hypothetical protein AYL99_02492 [Fonsecaea erecta]|uniref:Xylanolytic transcriptional activator regulatory domain-containing protein n=1 Tax=Fonsecaea erecta TaxID=1367422 RepID=A0A178ZWA1_9EURO|nr:hypothetical protein AYL99_02492 [Fonsecaea erecta]OAP63265.1 hypothetical protein AYL99_02492 [Fonsecaea erecta]
MLSDCIYPEPRRKKRKRLRTAEHVESLQNRIEVLESCIKNLTRSASPTRTPLAKGGHLAGQPCPYAHEDSPEGSDEDISRTAPKFILTRHAIEDPGDVFQGYSGDRAFIQRMRERIKDWPGDNVRSRMYPPKRQTANLFDCDYSLAATTCLPPKEWARALVDAAVQSYSLFPILHRPSFDRSFEDLYAIRPNDYMAEELRFIPLLYAVLALGCMFIQADPQKSSREQEIAEGLQYFAASRAFIDISDCTDAVSLQTLIFLILFTIGTSRAGTCYSYVTHALTLALRMGLHRSKSQYDDLIEREVGRRVFWVLRLLGNYFATACGMPRLLNDENVDQDLPVEVNDAYITKTGIAPQPLDEVCTVAGLNSLIALYKILEQVVRDIYPPRGISKTHGKLAATYLVRIEKVKDIERALKRWMESLPFGFRLKSHTSPRSLLRTQYLLRMSHAHVQLYLYRPFLHYLSRASDENTSSSNITFSPYAAACVRACHTILSLSGEMCESDLLQGGGFTVLHMIFGSVVTFLFIILDSADWEGRESAFEDISIGRKALAFLAKCNNAAERAQTVLEKTVISLLPAEFAETRERLQRQGPSVTDFSIPNSERTNGSLVSFDMNSQGLSEMSIDETSSRVTVPIQFDRSMAPTGHTIDPDQQMKGGAAKCQRFPGGAYTHAMSSGRAEGGTFSASLHREAMQENMQDHLLPQPTMPCALQGGGDTRIIPPPYGDPTAEFLEAQHFNFSTDYLGDVWNSINQFPEPINSEQHGNQFQMMDMPNLMSFHEARGLFNFDYLP